MLEHSSFSLTICVFLFITHCLGYFGGQEDEDNCFCQLQGRIDDCSCFVDTVDTFNNIKIYPRLRSLLTKDYFRFYKVNLQRKCPFWEDDSRCAIRYCHVEFCDDSDIPKGLKGAIKKTLLMSDNGVGKYLKADDCDHNNELSYLNTTISAKVQGDLVLWKAYDDAQDNFCVLDDNDEDAEYVDLLLNPERYTGYKGQSAHRIWNSIYMENCFRPSTHSFYPYIPNDKLNDMCLEQRVFYRAISGIHSSINIHLSAKYLLSEATGLSLTSPKEGVWGHNVSEFVNRFSPETTDGQGPNWLKNLYFVYLLELRALQKASPYLVREEFYTGNDAEDWDTQQAIKDLLKVINSFPQHFDETTMFVDDQAYLKQQFITHFRNITKIMDCVGCDKCKLWGKLQTQGLGTALKILFLGKFDKKDNEVFIKSEDKKDFQLQRSEIVSLLNSIGRLSNSIYELDEFRHMVR